MTLLDATDTATKALRQARALSLALASADKELVWGDIRSVADVLFDEIVEAQEALETIMNAASD